MAGPLWPRPASTGLTTSRARARPVIDEVAVLAETLADKGKPPAHLGVTHWSARLMAERLGISFASVARIWRKWNIQPHRVETFKFSTDPELEAKLRDVVGLYLDPPAGAVVVSVDEKSQIQALDRTQPILPLRQGIPEQQTHDYIRHGTTSLFAALEVATGKVTADACYPRHTHAEFLAFLKLVAKAHPRVRIARHLRQLRHPQAPQHPALGCQEPQNHPAFHADELLVAEHGRDLLRHHHPPSHPPRHLHRRRRPRDRDPSPTSTAYNERAKPFAWTKTADALLAKIKRKSINNTRHQ